VILLRRRDRLGNCLFGYTFARVLAQRFGYGLAASPLPGFSGTFAEVPGEEVYGPVARWEGQWPFDGHSGRRLVRAEFFQAPGQRVTLAGWFQRFEFIAEAREEIRRDWLRLDRALLPRPSGDFAICLRLGDYTQNSATPEENSQADSFANSVLREDEVRRLVRSVPHTRLFIVTAQPDHPLVAALGDLRAEIVSGEPMEDFRFIHSCRKVAICQSTFHWWAAFLGAAREIYFPRCDRGIWSKPAPAVCLGDPVHYGIDLRVDEERYVYDW
jgi:hypothetical protein